jgi:hypothetical protein
VHLPHHYTWLLMRIFTARKEMRKSFDSMLVPFTINFDQDAVSVALASHSM